MFIISITILGLLVGSAINAIVWRLYVGRSWVHGRSMCPECQHELAAKDLVPVVSWVLLRGRCRYCKAKIHWQYPVVEALTAVLFGLSAWSLLPHDALTGVVFGLWLLLLTMIIVLSVYDLRWMILPDKVMLPAIGVAALILAGTAWHAGSLVALRGSLLAALASGGVFYAVAALSGGRAMGGGDIKFAFMMGLILGLRGTALAMMVAFDVAALVAIGLMLARRRGRRDMIPFGPFLAAGTVVAYLYGHQIISWYLRANGLE